ncbi:mannose-1-phosphate guanylyltransferase [Actinomadura chibensis]|uniref:NTP transferase domain-containing protein n=1 Tax=Actinomadura chibensis TaxID=392828 RepID=A0A5D0NTR5_9ACTN|nr:sugar phosphate nucleotidyltransferase [Actinomadura chibensis]TYB47856.1 NTP transferase domain-containing protein [Actinomadura chibensis]
MNLHVVVLAGGQGTRLWPLSRQRAPKFLLDVGLGEPLLADALRRAVRLTDPSRVHIVTGADHVQEVRAIAAPFRVLQVIVEPSARDTAAALCLATGVVARADPDATLVSLPADQVVRDTRQRWTDVLARAVDAAQTGHRLVCVGLVPEEPKTGLGYIRAPATRDPGGARPVLAFHEKPDRATAEDYVASGECFWNTAIMAWEAETFAAMVGAHAPHLAPLLAPGPLNRERWESVPRMAIEPALLEPAAAAGSLSLVPAAFEWSDVGSWTTVARLDGTEPGESVIRRDADGCFVHPTPGRRYVLLGTRNLVIVDTGDVVLIADRDSDQDLKGLVSGPIRQTWPDLL